MKRLYLVVITILVIFSSNVFAAESFAPPTGEKLQVILTDFENYAIRAMKDWQVPGMAIAIVKENDVIYAKGFGVKEIGKPDLVDTDTVFQIGSTSKAFTAALVSMMVDEKNFGWKDEVIGILPEFVMYDPWVTRQFQVVDLMAQRSGLPSSAGDGQSMLGFDRQHIIHSLRYLHPTTSFRSEYAYQNGLFLVAAALVEKSTGKSWETNIEERLFKPLNMTNSSTSLDVYRSTKDKAIPHHIVDGKVVAIPLDQRAFDWTFIYGPAGGITSNVTDMAKWVQLQLSEGKYRGKQLVSSENIKFMHEPKIYINPEIGSYCLAWIKTDYCPYPLIWHNGGTPGIKSVVELIPDADVGIVVLTNLGNTILPEALGRRFADLYLGNPPQDWSKMTLATAKRQKQAEAAKLVPPKNPDPPLPLEQYTGKYSSPVYGDAIVTAEDGNLIMAVGPNRLQMTLHPWNHDTFQVNEKDIEITTLVEFKIGSEKTPTSLTVAELNDGGDGVFMRVTKD